MTLKRNTRLKRKTPLRRSKLAPKRPRRTTRTKTTKKDKLRSWGLPETFQWRGLRYKNPYQKGIYWYWFSLEVRRRDVEQFGVCISCNKPITIETSQAGHFINASKCGRDLLFDLMNVHAECPGCNKWDTRKLRYEKNLISRYGVKVVEDLKERYYQYDNGSILKDFTGKEYEERIRILSTYQQAEI